MFFIGHELLYNPWEPLIHGSNTNFQPTRNVQLWLNLHIGWKWGRLAEGALSKIGARQFSDTAKPPFSINQLKRALIARDGVKVGRAAFSATFCGNLCAGKLLRASCTNFYFTLSFQTGSHRSKQCKCQDQRSLNCLRMVLHLLSNHEPWRTVIGKLIFVSYCWQHKSYNVKMVFLTNWSRFCSEKSYQIRFRFLCQSNLRKCKHIIAIPQIIQFWYTRPVKRTPKNV